MKYIHGNKSGFAIDDPHKIAYLNFSLRTEQKDKSGESLVASVTGPPSPHRPPVIVSNLVTGIQNTGSCKTNGIKSEITHKL
jgi:hypothetical protein